LAILKSKNPVDRLWHFVRLDNSKKKLYGIVKADYSLFPEYVENYSDVTVFNTVPYGYHLNDAIKYLKDKDATVVYYSEAKKDNEKTYQVILSDLYKILTKLETSSLDDISRFELPILKKYLTKTLNPSKYDITRGLKVPKRTAQGKGIGFDLPIDDKGQIPLSFIGYLFEFKYVSVKNGKTIKHTVKGKDLSVWESKDKDVLFIMKAKAKGKGKAHSKAVANYKEFYWRNPSKIMSGTIDLKSGDKIIYLGTAIKLDYVSDKFDKEERTHTHDFVKSHIVAKNSKGNLLMIMPVSVNERGILS